MYCVKLKLVVVGKCGGGFLAEITGAVSKQVCLTWTLTLLLFRLPHPSPNSNLEPFLLGLGAFQSPKGNAGNLEVTTTTAPVGVDFSLT